MTNPLCSIIIRAKNEEVLIGETLRAVFSQKLDDFEVVFVDSGSTDNTLEIVQEFNVRIIEIPPEEFTYGRALNIGAGEANGRYLVMLTAHSPPCSDQWLEELIRPLQEDPSCAGVYGRQRGKREVNPFEACALDYGYGHFEKNRSKPLVFSNVNSAILRDDWVQYPFDDEVSGSEDYLWAKQMQAGGRNIRYAPDAAVWHVHDETFDQRVHRIFREKTVIFGVDPPSPRSLSVVQMLWDHLLMPARILYFMVTRRIGLWWLHKGLIFFYAYWFGNYKALKFYFRGQDFYSA